MAGPPFMSTTGIVSKSGPAAEQSQPEGPLFPQYCAVGRGDISESELESLHGEGWMTEAEEAHLLSVITPAFFLPTPL